MGQAAAKKNSQLDNEALRDEASEIVENHFKEVRSQQIVPPRFKQVVYQTLDWLLGLKCHLSGLNKIYHLEDEDITVSKDIISEVVNESLKKSLPPVFNALAESLQGVSGNIQKASLEYLRTKLKQLIYQGDAPDKITSRPPRHQAQRQGRHTHHLLSDCLRRYFVEELANSAVEDRAEYLLRQLVHLHVKMKVEHIRVLFLGANNVEDLMNLVDGHPELHDAPFEFHIVDESEVDLKRLENRFATFNQLNRAAFQVTTYPSELHKVVSKPPFESAKFDLIYTAGEFDYLDEKQSQSVAQCLYGNLEDQGRVIIGVYSLSDPSHLTMSTALDWELSFRTNDDFKVIFGSIGRKFSIERQGLTANIFCIIKK